MSLASAPSATSSSSSEGTSPPPASPPRPLPPESASEPDSPPSLQASPSLPLRARPPSPPLSEGEPALWDSLELPAPPSVPPAAPPAALPPPSPALPLPLPLALAPPAAPISSSPSPLPLLAPLPLGDPGGPGYCRAAPSSSSPLPSPPSCSFRLPAPIRVVPAQALAVQLAAPVPLSVRGMWLQPCGYSHACMGRPPAAATRQADAAAHLMPCSHQPNKPPTKLFLVVLLACCQLLRHALRAQQPLHHRCMGSGLRRLSRRCRCLRACQPGRGGRLQACVEAPARVGPCCLLLVSAL